MVSKGNFSFEYRNLKPAPIFNRPGVRRVDFPSFRSVIAVESPQPDIRIIQEIVPAQKSPYTIGYLQGVARIDKVEPHQGTKEY